MWGGVQEIIFAAGGLALLVLNAGCAVIKADWRQLPATLCRIHAGIKQQMLGCCCGQYMGQGTGELEEAVRGKVGMMRLQQSRNLVMGLRLFFAVAICRMLLLRFSGYLLQSFTQDLIVLLAYTGVTICPRFLNRDTMHQWVCGFMVITLLYGLPLISQPDFRHDANSMAFLGLCTICMCHMHPTMALLSNVAYFVTTFVSFSAVNGLDMEMSRQLTLRITVAGAVCGFIWLTEHRWRVQAQSELEARLLESKNSAAHALLSMFYDVVTELDSDLNICSSADRLAQFLERGHGQAPLSGTSFLELLEKEEDQARFEERVRLASERRESMADVMHVDVVLGCGRRRQAEIFSFHFASISGQLCYLLGIRDNSDDVAGCLQSQTETQVTSETLEQPQGNVTIVVDAFDACVIISSSAAFNQLMGVVSPGQQLQGMVRPLANFLQWLQDICNMHLVGQPPDLIERKNKFKVWLRPQGCSSSMHFVAICRLAILADNENSAHGEVQLHEQQAGEGQMDMNGTGGGSCHDIEDGRLLVQLEFTSITRTKHARAAASNSNSSSSSSSRRARRGTPVHYTRSRLGRSHKVIL